MEEYIASGVRLGWLIDRKQRCVWVYRPGVAVQMLENPASLSGDDVLPGFLLDMSLVE